MFAGAEDFMGCSDCTEALDVCFSLNIYVKLGGGPACSLSGQDSGGSA